MVSRFIHLPVGLVPAVNLRQIPKYCHNGLAAGNFLHVDSVQMLESPESVCGVLANRTPQMASILT